MTRIWFISDTHNAHEELQVPPGIDVVIHCGDESNAGNAWFNEEEARRFFAWYSALEIPYKIFTPGNHSTAVEKTLIGSDEFPQVAFLIHDQFTCQGLRVFGSPYTPEFFDWAYMKARSDLLSVWQSVPSGVDILITHGPPKGILDVTMDVESGQPIHVGSHSLTRQVMQRIRPRIHAFGHIHDEENITNFGSVRRDGIQFINCACCDSNYDLVHHGLVVELL